MAADATVTRAVRQPLSRDRVLRAAVALADEQGLDAVTMRRLGEQLGVEAMSLYNHVQSKRDLLDGMIDELIGEVDATAAVTEDDVAADHDWRDRMRRLSMAAHEVMLAHPWGPELVASLGEVTPRLMVYFDQIIGIFLDGGFGPDLAHHAVHALGSRMLGFNQELFVDNSTDAPPTEVVAEQLAASFPNLAAMMRQVAADAAITGQGCDSRVEFRFALDLLLDGLETRRVAAASPA